MNYYRLVTLLVAVLTLPLAHAQPGYDVPIPPPKPPQLTAKPVSAPAPIEAEKQAKPQGAAKVANVTELERKLAAARVLAPGQVIQDCPDCPKMVVIPAGTFTMGSPDSEAGRSGDEGPQHSARVEIFLLGQTEVTVAQFRRFVQAKNYKTEAERNVGKSGCFGVDAGDGKADWRSGRSWRSPGWDIADNEPVTCVSWNDANAYLAWLSELTKQPYHLPTEAQWEYAARAGTSTSRYWGDDPKQACLYDNVSNVVAHFGGGLVAITKEICDDGFRFVAPVAKFRPNDFGLYDMLGNVREWTADCYNAKEYNRRADSGLWPASKTSDNKACLIVDSLRVLRGGSWEANPGDIRAARRSGNWQGGRGSDVGFRLARMISPGS